MMQVHRLDRSQKEFDEYIRNLGDSHSCKYSEAIGSIVLFCNNNFTCRFQSKIPLKHRGNRKFECNRQKYIKLKKILG